MIHVLLVEDDPGDVLITREAFAENKVRNQLSVVNDGVNALAFLRREGGYADAPRPDLILLDLNLPKMAGHEVLEQIKSDADLQRIPVVVLTTSDAEEDVLAQLRPARERLRHQAGRLRALPRASSARSTTSSSPSSSCRPSNVGVDQPAELRHSKLLGMKLAAGCWTGGATTWPRGRSLSTSPPPSPSHPGCCRRRSSPGEPTS